MNAMTRWLLAAVFVLVLALTDSADAMTFHARWNGGHCHEDCGWVAAVGEITPDTPKEFARFHATQLPGLYTIFFDSPGGDLMAGIRLGEMIRARNLATAVGASTLYDRSLSRTIHNDPENGTCISACAFALLGGERRFFAGTERKESEGKVGVRQLVGAPALRKPSGKQSNAPNLAVNRLVSVLIDYVSKMGGDPRMIAIAASTPPGRVRYFSSAELRDLKISWDPRVFGPWTLEPFGNGAVARSVTPDRSETATFFCTQDRVPHLVIVSPRLGDEQELRGSVEALEGHELEALGKKWPPSAAGVQINDGRPALDLTLTGFDPEDIRAAKDIAVHSPWAYDFGWGYPLPAERALETFRIAARNCV